MQMHGVSGQTANSIPCNEVFFWDQLELLLKRKAPTLLLLTDMPSPTVLQNHKQVKLQELVESQILRTNKPAPSQLLEFYLIIQLRSSCQTHQLLQSRSDITQLSLSSILLSNSLPAIASNYIKSRGDQEFLLKSM